MSSTNKTTNYNLSQYIGTDKPTYLGDYNSDMSKIDEGIKQAADEATTASSKAGTASSNASLALQKASEASEKADTAQETAEAAQTSASGALSTATAANNLAGTANTAASDAQSRLNANVWTTAAAPTNLHSNASFPSPTDQKQVKFSYNPFLNLLRASGGLSLLSGINLNAGEVLFTLPSSIPRPITTRHIVCAGVIWYGTSNITKMFAVDIDTNGNVKWNYTSVTQPTELYFQNMFDTTGWFN